MGLAYIDASFPLQLTAKWAARIAIDGIITVVIATISVSLCLSVCLCLLATADQQNGSNVQMTAVGDAVMAAGRNVISQNDINSTQS